MARHSRAHDAVIAAPFGRLGIRIRAGRLAGVDFLPPRTRLRPPRDVFARRVCRALRAYLADPRRPVTLPLALDGSAHERRVWRALRRIPAGEVRRYGEIARRLGSSARAVGGACRRNPVPIAVPCHRVVGAAGVGGFMGRSSGAAVDIKRWLLAHEGRG